MYFNFRVKNGLYDLRNLIKVVLQDKLKTTSLLLAAALGTLPPLANAALKPLAPNRSKSWIRPSLKCAA